MTALAESGPSLSATSEKELSSVGRLAIRAAVTSTLFLTQIAYNIGDFPVTMEFVSYAALVVYMLISGHATVSVPTIFLYIATVTCALAAMKLTVLPASSSSLLLLFALYAPFSFRLRAGPDLKAVHEAIQGTFVSATTVIAIIAIAQFAIVNALKVNALTNIYFILPEAIRGGGTYTFLREGGSLVKANGFFLRESADLSLMTALALLIEISTRARFVIIGALAAALLCSFSGSGMLALMLGLVLPRTVGRLPLFVASATTLILVMLMLYYADIPGINNLFFDRLAEINQPGTSGYARYVAPKAMVDLNLHNGGIGMWLGNGGGSYLRSTMLLRVKYEIADPTWAKLTFEYGLLGLALLGSIFAIRVYSSALDVRICNYILFVWVVNSAVLKIQYVLVFWLLTLVPKIPARRNGFGSSAPPSTRNSQ
ncbi:hypothetical protein [Bradyrhizobium commune]|uniref:O-antigen ligase domain-containing protein n=1 Tax=Bradyrhizobium commune TaxID=83627 RepID=A0A7S9GYW3_9BRAD|nr:hypothetical protein [Bradyrhizobium commune]QPF90271.1 hypothetical protein IC761_27790 [Bradyrhizobium commune]